MKTGLSALIQSAMDSGLLIHNGLFRTLAS